MKNELGGLSKDGRQFGIQTDDVKKEAPMNIDIFRKVDLDTIPGGASTIASIVKEALIKELPSVEQLKLLTISDDGELYYKGDRFVKAKEIFAD